MPLQGTRSRIGIKSDVIAVVSVEQLEAEGFFTKGGINVTRMVSGAMEAKTLYIRFWRISMGRTGLPGSANLELLANRI